MRVSDSEGSDGLRLKKRENGKEKKNKKTTRREKEMAKRDREEMAEQKGDGREKE